MKVKILIITLGLLISVLVNAKKELHACPNSIEIDLSKKQTKSSFSGCLAGDYVVSILIPQEIESYFVEYKIENVNREALAQPGSIKPPAKKNNLARTSNDTETHEFTLQQQQKLTILVTAKTKNKEKTWKASIDTGDKSKWVASWSIAIVNNQDENYYTDEIASTGTYTIVQKPKNNDLKLIPSVFYTNNYPFSNNWSGGPSLGLGLDTNNLTPFLGFNTTYKDNIGITAGIAWNKRKVLLGEFSNISESNPLSENISTLTVDIYKQSGFVALTYRFK